MPKKIFIAALNIKRSDSCYEAYEALSAREKINLICAQIEKTCKALQKTNPDAQWIVAWREYGIFEPNSKFLSPENEKILRTRIATITNQYPNLAVISGTIATKSPTKLSAEEREAILMEYGGSSRVKELEEESDPASPHRAPHPETLQVVKHLKKISGMQLNTEVEVVKNTTYIFQGDSVKSHGKTAPYQETKEENELETAIYSPGKYSTQTPRVELTHSNNGESFVVGVEICREHDFEVLRHAPGPTPLIHFVISDGVNLNLANTEGKYVVQIDSMIQPSLIQNMNEMYSGFEVCLMQMNALDKEAVLSEPTMSYIPFERVVIKMFDKIIKQFTDKDPKYIALETMRKDFIESTKSIDCTSMYKCLDENIVKFGEVLKKSDGKTFLSSFAEFFFYKPPSKINSHQFVYELQSLLNAEKAKEYVKKDFLSGGPAAAVVVAPPNKAEPRP